MVQNTSRVVNIKQLGSETLVAIEVNPDMLVKDFRELVH
jgi:hypothetical protein